MDVRNRGCVNVSRYNEDNNLQINFDVEVHDLECRNLKVLVFDMFGEEPINRISNDFTYRPIDKKGNFAGASYRNTDDDLHGNRHLKEQEEKIIKETGKAEIDADWSSSHDGFKHQSFEKVVQAHDFTLINFFAEWCSHCRNFHPTWTQIAKKIISAGAGSVANKVTGGSEGQAHLGSSMSDNTSSGNSGSAPMWKKHWD